MNVDLPLPQHHFAKMMEMRAIVSASTAALSVLEQARLSATKPLKTCYGGTIIIHHLLLLLLSCHGNYNAGEVYLPIKFLQRSSIKIFRARKLIPCQATNFSYTLTPSSSMPSALIDAISFKSWATANFKSIKHHHQYEIGLRVPYK